MSEELKPCPFCGSDDVDLQCYEDDGFHVVCGKCGGNMPGWDDPDEAIEAWNRRAGNE